MSDDALEELRSRVLADAQTPEPVRRALERGAALESIHLDARGRWWHQGEPFTNEKLALLFSRSLFQTAQGVWFLRIGDQSYPVTVAEAGSFGLRVRFSETEAWLTLSTEEEVEVTDASWFTDGDELLGLRLDDGRDVRLVGSAHQEALARVEPLGDGWGIRLQGGLCSLGPWPSRPRGRWLAGGSAQG